jgi:hypothetical protein
VSRTRPVAVAEREVGDLSVMDTMVGLPVSEEMCVKRGSSFATFEEEEE